MTASPMRAIGNSAAFPEPVERWRGNARTRCRAERASSRSRTAGRRGGAGGRTSANAAGERCARTTARRRRLGLLPARPRPFAGLPLERGRPGGHLRRPADPVPRTRLLERPRPDPEGADLRPRRPGRQPRRGRQGVLVVPRLDPDPLLDALALHVPAGRVPVRAAARREPPRARSSSRSSSCSTRGSSTAGATGRSPPTTPRPRPRTCCFASASGTPGRSPRRSTSSPRCGSATRGRGTSGRRSRRSTSASTAWSRSIPSSGSASSRRAARPRRSSATTRRTRPGSSAADDSPPYPKDGINDHVVAGAADRQPGADRDEGGVPLPPRGRRRARRPSSSCGSATATAGLGGRLRAGSRRPASAKPTSSTQS